MLTQEEMKRMTYAELEAAGVLVDYHLRNCMDPNLKRQLIDESVAIGFEMDRRGEEWEKRWKEMERKGKK